LWRLKDASGLYNVFFSLGRACFFVHGGNGKKFMSMASGDEIRNELIDPNPTTAISSL
jgi:hypothetical protein